MSTFIPLPDDADGEECFQIVMEALQGLEIEKHYGPGPHKSGSPQSVHGGDDVTKPETRTKRLVRRLFHGLRDASGLNDLLREGWEFGHWSLGKMWGDGAYTTPYVDEAHFWAGSQGYVVEVELDDEAQIIKIDLGSRTDLTGVNFNSDALIGFLIQRRADQRVIDAFNEASTASVTPEEWPFKVRHAMTSRGIDGIEIVIDYDFTDRDERAYAATRAGGNQVVLYNTQRIRQMRLITQSPGFTGPAQWIRKGRTLYMVLVPPPDEQVEFTFIPNMNDGEHEV